MKYVALLRGINVNGRKVLKEDLQKVFEEYGLSQVKTIIASGNVLFDTELKDEKSLAEKIEEYLSEKFGFRIPVILRTLTQIQALVAKDPFANRRIDEKSRLQITFFTNKIDKKQLEEKEGFSLLSIGDREVASIVNPGGKTTDLMTFLDKTFGKNSTTRNWRTVKKLLG